MLLRRKYDVFIIGNDILGLDSWLCCLLARFLRIPVCIWGQGLSRPPSRFRDGLRFALTSLSTAAIYYTDGGRDYWQRKAGYPARSSSLPTMRWIPTAADSDSDANHVGRSGCSP